MNPRFMRNGALMLVLALGVAALLYTWLNSSTTADSQGYGTFLSQVADGQVTKVTQRADTLTVVKTDGSTYTVTVPSVLTQVVTDMRQATTDAGKTFDPSIYCAEAAPDNGWLLTAVSVVLPLVVIGAFIYFMMRQAQGTNNQAL